MSLLNLAIKCVMLFSFFFIATAVVLRRSRETDEQYVTRINKGLTWVCHICKEERPDAKISVLTKPLMFEGKQLGRQNVRYCNDKPSCLEGAKEFEF